MLLHQPCKSSMHDCTSLLLRLQTKQNWIVWKSRCGGPLQPGYCGTKLTKEMCHDLICSAFSPVPYIFIIFELMLHLGSQKYRSDPNAECDTSDAESELANELFADYLSGVAKMHITVVVGFFFESWVYSQTSTSLGRICKENFKDSSNDLQSAKEEFLVSTEISNVWGISFSLLYHVYRTYPLLDPKEESSMCCARLPGLGKTKRTHAETCTA